MVGGVQEVKPLLNIWHGRNLFIWPFGNGSTFSALLFKMTSHHKEKRAQLLESENIGNGLISSICYLV
jgi:hypothetical protein